MFKKGNDLAIRRAKRVRYKLKKRSCGKLRLSVYKSSKHLYAQVIDDQQGFTLVSASTSEKGFFDGVENGGHKNMANIEFAKKIGALIAARLIEKGFHSVVFDKGANAYHGKIAALADAARNSGLDF